MILCVDSKPWRTGHRRPGYHELSSCQRNALCYDIGIDQRLLSRFQHTDSMSATLYIALDCLHAQEQGANFDSRC